MEATPDLSLPKTSPIPDEEISQQPPSPRHPQKRIEDLEEKLQKDLTVQNLMNQSSLMTSEYNMLNIKVEGLLRKISGCNGELSCL